jgi:hypothetical protein
MVMQDSPIALQLPKDQREVTGGGDPPVIFRAKKYVPAQGQRVLQAEFYDFDGLESERVASGPGSPVAVEVTVTYLSPPPRDTISPRKCKVFGPPVVVQKTLQVAAIPGSGGCQKHLFNPPSRAGRDRSRV